MSGRPDVSVIIPMRNASTTICRVVESFLDIVVPTIEVIVVDDGSTDRSVERVLALNREGVIIESMGHNCGPGAARNRGFAKATGRYALFFDADDESHGSTLRAAVEVLDTTGADVVVMQYRYRRGNGASDEMNSFDAAFWSQVGNVPRRPWRLDEVPQLLGLSNYPWNKLARIDHYRTTGLRYGSTRVHEDILGHWLTLLDARSVALLDKPLCTHIVNEGGRNQTNRDGLVRLALLDALDETYWRVDLIVLRFCGMMWSWSTTQLRL